MASDKEDRIRAKANEIWLSEGSPEGAEMRHWDMATAAVEAEDSAAETPDETAPKIPTPEPEVESAAKPAPKKRAPRASKTAPPVASPTAHENEGKADAAPKKRAPRAKRSEPTAG